MSFSENREKLDATAPPKEAQEKEISIDLALSDSLDDVEDASMVLEENQEALDATAPSKEAQEKEISIDLALSDSLDDKEDASVILEKNQEALEATAPSKEAPEKEISIDITPSDSLDDVEDASVILEENWAPSDAIAPAEETQDKKLSTVETALVDPGEQAEKLTETFSSEVDTVQIRPANQAIPTLPIPFSIKNTESLKTAPDAPAVNKPSNKMIAVGGAKGGIGKSMLSANLAVGLALLGQQVVLADLDLGGADVHLYTGVKSLAKTWNDFLDKKVDCIKDILTPTAFEGLSLIGGNSSKLGSANLPYLQKLKIIRHLKALETDFLVVDLGGNTAYNSLDFFLQADQKIIVSGTEPASVMDSYAFVKVVYYRFLERFFSQHKLLKDLAERIKDSSLEKSSNYSLDFIFQEVRIRNPKALIELKKQLNQFRLSIVLNMTESSIDVRIAESMQKLIKDKCFQNIRILGTIPFDKAVCRAARKFVPIVVENTKCQVSRNIHQMLAAIIYRYGQEITQS
ncbi:MAG: P-loop NTPase [Desulfobacterales bacterium]